MESVVEDYIRLGLRLGRHVDGFVDAYYGPESLTHEVSAEPIMAPARLAEDAGRLLTGLDDGAGDLDDGRRRWLRAQAFGLATSARKLRGDDVGYLDEVEASYGVRPRWVDEEVFAEAHRSLDDVLRGAGPLHERCVAWRESHATPVDVLPAVLRDLADDFRDRTGRLFGLPDGEHVDLELVADKPWSGFNHYLGGLRSRVEINVDLPVLSLSLGHLVAHEAYPGHHTEHVRKEVGLVRRRQWWEESIFLVGTPQCLLAEGLADLGIEVLLGERPEPALAEHLRPHGLRFDPEVVAAVSRAGEVLGSVRSNAAILLHEQGRPTEDVVDYVALWALLPRSRAEKAVVFLTDPTWRAYISCYVEGLPLCRSFVGGDPTRYARLLTEQLTPADLS
jgi:hypothetical protein